MTVAVQLPGPWPPMAERLAAQLRAAGAREVVVAGGPHKLAAVARAAREPLLVCAGDLVAHDAVIRRIATAPGDGTVALVLCADDAPGADPVRAERGLLVPGTPATGVDGGLLRVGVGDLPALAQFATAPGGLVANLLAAGATITAEPVRLLVARRVCAPPEAKAAEAVIGTVDSDAVELRLAVKERDDFFATYAVSSWSPYLVKAAARGGISPTAVTVLSMIVTAAAAVLFAWGAGRTPWLVGAGLLYAGFVLDRVDGQLARYTRTFSAYGGWLDTMADRAKEYLVYAGLAVGAGQWGLAIVAIMLQTVRHMSDTWYRLLHDRAVRSPDGAPRSRLGDVAERVQADTGSLAYWLKRTVLFPVGERWALIALAVALFDPYVALVAVVVCGALAFAYTLVLRGARARTMRVDPFAGVDRTVQRDDGPLAMAIGRMRVGPLAGAVAAVVVAATALAAPGLRPVTLAAAALVIIAGALPAAAPHDRAIDFLVPAALRAAEYLFVAGVGIGYGVPAPVTYALLFALALHHYDLTSRAEKRLRPPQARAATLGWDGRIVVLAVAAATGTATTATALLAGYVFLVFVVAASSGWAKAVNRAHGEVRQTTMT